MKTTTRTTILVLASLGLGLGAMAELERGDEPETHDAEGASSAALRARRGLQGTMVEGQCAFEPGARMAYEVRTESSARIDMGPLMAGMRLDDPEVTAQATAVDQQAARQWHVELRAIARTTDGSTVLAARIEGGETTVVGTDGGGTTNRISQPPLADLGQTFLLRLDERCGVREFGWRSDGDRDAARDQQQLLAGLGWLAPRGDEPSWTGTLIDPLGRYHAGFSASADGRVRGRAVSYGESFGRGIGGGRPTLEVVSSDIEIEPRPGEWFGTLSNVRSLSLVMQGIPVGTLEGTVTARAVEPSAWEPEVSLDDGGWSWGLLLGQGGSSRSAEARASAALAAVSAPDMLARYLDLVHGGRSSAETVALLTEWLRAHPEGAGELVALLRAGALDGEQSGSAGLFLALGKANTPEAADALLSIIEGPTDAMGHRISAAHALSKIESPTAAMVNAVVAVTEREDIHPMERGSLAMTLGAFANRNAERSPELAAMARDQIEGWLAEPTSTEDLAGSLLAAGNTGHDALVPAIEPYLEHEDPQIRQRAARAMRGMSPEEAYPRLSASLDDEDATVRASAVEAMTQVSRSNGVAPPEATVDLAIEHLDSAGAPVREHKALLSLLGEASEHGNVGARAVLQQHFEDELGRDGRDIDKLRAMGRHTNTRWTAD